MSDLKKIIIDGHEVEVDGAMTILQAVEVSGARFLVFATASG